MVTILRLWPENLSQKVAGTTFLRQPLIRLTLALTLLIQANLSYPACTNLTGRFNNGLASAATGQVLSQYPLTYPGPLLTELFKYGVFIGAFDSMRATISKLFECPIEYPIKNAYEVIDSMSVSTRRTIVSGLIHHYLLANGYRMEPVLYSGLYTAADTLLIGSEIMNDALWHSFLAMAFSIAGRAVASCFPNHNRLTANLATQLTLIYGTALAYITYFELKNN